MLNGSENYMPQMNIKQQKPAIALHVLQFGYNGEIENTFIITHTNYNPLFLKYAKVLAITKPANRCADSRR